jgi:CarD family transcriptional regulator
LYYTSLFQNLIKILSNSKIIYLVGKDLTGPFQRRTMFRLNEKVVYPGHGVAQINSIIEKNVSSKVVAFYELCFLHKEMTILIPTENVESTGIRKLTTQANIKNIVKVLAEPLKKINPQEFGMSNWNKRSKQYSFKLKSGDLVEIAKIYRELQCMSQQKELSFGERSLLVQTEELLTEEISLVKNTVEEETLDFLRGFFTQPKFQEKTAQMQLYI